MGLGLRAVAPRCLSRENAGRRMTVLHHALCGGDFHQTPVSIIFRGKCSKFCFCFCVPCNTGVHVQLRKPGTKPVIPGSIPFSTVRKTHPPWMTADRLGFVERARTRGGEGPIPGSEILPHLYNFDEPGTRTVVLRVDTAPHDAESPMWGS